jgi:hypothetical protein
LVPTDQGVLATGYTDLFPWRLQAVDLQSGNFSAPSLAEEFVVDSLTIGRDSFYLGVTPLNDESGYTDPGRVRIERRDLATGELFDEPLPGYLDVAAGGAVVIAASPEGTISEIDPTTMQPVGLPFPGITGPVQALDLDDEGRRLIVHGGDGALRIYDVASRTQLGDPIFGAATLDRGSSAIRGDGLEAAADTPTGIDVWDLDPNHWTQAACQLAGRNLTRAEWDQYIGNLAPYRTTCPEHAAAA